MPSACNKLSKYDINLLVPEHTDVCLADEFINITQWSAENKMIINRIKTSEIIFRRSSPVRFHLAPSLEGIEMSYCIKVLGINLQQNESHVTALLKQCSQRIYLLRICYVAKDCLLTI